MEEEQFYELLVQAEKLYNAGQISNAKEILELLISTDSQKNEYEIQAYIRILYAEIVMVENPFDDSLCRELLFQAEDYCSKDINYDTKIELLTCIYIDYSKLYIDKGDYCKSRNYVFQAMKLSIDLGNKEYYVGAVHNFVLLCQTCTLFEEQPEIIGEFGEIIKKILFDNKADIEKSQLVVLSIKMSEIMFIKGDAKQGNLWLQRGLELDVETDNKCAIMHTYIVRFGYIACAYIERKLLTQIVTVISRASINFIDDIIQLDDEKTVYDLCVDISGILRVFISLYNSNEIDCSKEEYFEIVVNLKNIYSRVLCLRHDNKIEYKKWMSYTELIEKIPDNTVVVDYTQFPVKLKKNRLLGDLILACFSVKKQNGEITLSYHNPIYLLYERTLHLFLNASTRTDQEETAELINDNFELNHNLYNILLSEVLTNISDKVDKLFVCPDVEISYIPFSILIDEDNKYIVDRFRIAYIDSLRIFEDEFNCGKLDKKSAVVLGDPRFTVDQKYKSVKNNLSPLPFSKVETEIVAELLETEPVIREHATKNSIKNSSCQILHIATHGEMQDIEDEEEGIVFPLSRCCIYFSGANDYHLSGVADSNYGNGNLTAEELISYDINSVKLCVLSICFSGNGQLDYSQGMLGFRTVFLSKGVRVLISSLWEVDDFASAVFFSKLYRLIFELPPSEALRKCQIYLKDVSLDELIEDGWFDKSRVKRLGLVASHMEELSHLPGETKLFNKHRYWAGFILTIQ